MIMTAPVTNTLSLPDAPEIPGLSFRRFQGESDYPGMAAIVNASHEADQIEWVESVEKLTNEYAHLTNCDPYTDMIFAQVHGSAVGYGRVMWRSVGSRALSLSGSA